jgi:uncharacterized protein (DUF1499 family)
MKTVFIILLFVVTALLTGLVYLGKSSRSGSPAGLVDGKLSICPGFSNCVCSEYKQGSNYIEPMVYPELEGADLSEIARIVQSMGGTVHEQTEDYLSSTFESSLFGFTDDLEVRIDKQKKMIHFRSASRVGRNDLGVNRQRVEQLKLLLSDK